MFDFLWLRQLQRRWFARRAVPPARQQRYIRPRLEVLEDRRLLANFTASSVTDLIADINAANTNGGSNTITLAPNTTFALRAVNNSADGPTGLPVIAAGDNLTIIGNGDTIERSTVPGSPAFRLFDVASGASLDLENVTLEDGLAAGTVVLSGQSVTTTDGEGGAIYSAGTLTVTDVTLFLNSAVGVSGGTSGSPTGGVGRGGAVYVAGGSATLSNDTLFFNQAHGSAGVSEASAPLANSGVSGGNGGSGYGGGLYVAAGMVTLRNDTFSTNTAAGGGGGSGQNTFLGGHPGPGGNGGSGFGGGVAVAGGDVNLANVTLTGNAAKAGFGGPGGVFPSGFSGGKGLAGSGSGGGMYVGSGSLSLVNTLIANNSADSFAPDVSGTIASSSHDLIGNTSDSSGFSTANGDILNPTFVGLSSLGHYGGSTETVALLPGSPAIDAGTSTGAPAQDQRGVGRVGAVDIGAFESRGFNVTVSGGNNQQAVVNTAFATPLSVQVTSNYHEPVQGGVVTFSAPSSGASASFPHGATATIYGNGNASVSATANGTVGTYSVTAAAGDSPNAVFTLNNLTSLSLTTATLPNGTYGAAYNQTFTATGGSGAYTFTVTAGTLPDGLSLASSGALTGTPTAAGTFSFTVQAKDGAGSTDSKSYTLTVTPATLTITPTANQSKAYGAAVPPLTYSASGFVNGDSTSLLTGALVTTATTSSSVGSYAITLGTLSAGSNYSVVLAANAPTFAVTPAPLTVTADNQNMTYGGSVPALTYHYTGLVNGDSSASLSGNLATTATSGSNAGSYAITQGTLTATGNYTIGTFNQATLTVNPATLTITPTANQSKLYGAAVPALTYSATGFVNNDSASLLTGSLATTATTSSSVGSYAFTTGNLSAGSNYTVVLAANAPTFAVTPAPLTITANNATMIQGQALPTFTVSYSGFVLGEDPSVLGGTLAFSTPATSSSMPGTYAITPSGLTSGNYAITFVPGTLTILSYGQATANLQAQVDAASLQHGIQNSLDAQLQAAIASFNAGNTNAGSHQLQAFIHHVSAQSGKHIDAALADAWIADAEQIINAV